MTAHEDYIYNDDGDPGPAPGSVPVCPVCSVGADRPPDMIAVASPPGYACGHCGWWVPPSGGRLTARQRELWAEANRR